MNGPFTYDGNELEMFAEATNWKRYIYNQVAPYLGDEVLEVGAGYGGSTLHVAKTPAARWVCLEPDPRLAERLRTRLEKGEFPACCEVKIGTVEELGADDTFDSLIYLDVMEHIEDDAAEFCRAIDHLKPGGHLVVLAPAHPWLFTPFDTALGHFRRYNRKMMHKLTKGSVDLVRLEYLDSVGFLASLANRLVLKQAMPTRSQVRTWDRMMVPLSRPLDGLLFHRVGKSILGVWKRN